MADAFYGILIAAAGLAGVKYLKTAYARKFMKLVLFCGVSTTIFGVLIGGYFGNIIDRFGIFSFAVPLKNKLMVFDPLEKSIEFLAACLVLGFIQTMLGSVLKLVSDLRRKNFREAFLADISVIGIQAAFPLLIIGELFGVKVAPTSWLLLALGLSSAALMANQWIVNDGIVLKIFQMFFSVYGAITGNALSDILSYSRLFALGLSTSLLAMVLNEVAALLFSSYIGIPFGILVLLLFHPFILLISSLGAYVHTSRLQYLEFFNKFFQGGGREMRPLSWVKKYTV
jgi:V/A-type H+-transporting ATPase subunit I